METQDLLGERLLWIYGGKGAHGGGAFSGKEIMSKVDRSAAYATRHVAKNFGSCRCM